MQTNYLCPVYRKWLQLHPEHARVQRQHIREQVKARQTHGDQEHAIELAGQVYEIAQSVLLALRQPQADPQQSGTDLVAFALAAQHLAQLHFDLDEKTLGETVLQSAQQQLTTLMPLFASEMTLVGLMQSLVHALSGQKQNTIQLSSTAIH